MTHSPFFFYLRRYFWTTHFIKLHGRILTGFQLIQSIISPGSQAETWTCKLDFSISHDHIYTYLYTHIRANSHTTIAWLAHSKFNTAQFFIAPSLQFDEHLAYRSIGMCRSFLWCICEVRIHPSNGFLSGKIRIDFCLPFFKAWSTSKLIISRHLIYANTHQRKKIDSDLLVLWHRLFQSVNLLFHLDIPDQFWHCSLSGPYSAFGVRIFTTKGLHRSNHSTSA